MNKNKLTSSSSSSFFAQTVCPQTYVGGSVHTSACRRVPRIIHQNITTNKQMSGVITVCSRRWRNECSPLSIIKHSQNLPWPILVSGFGTSHFAKVRPFVLATQCSLRMDSTPRLLPKSVWTKSRKHGPSASASKVYKNTFWRHKSFRVCSSHLNVPWNIIISHHTMKALFSGCLTFMEANFEKHKQSHYDTKFLFPWDCQNFGLVRNVH